MKWPFVVTGFVAVCFGNSKKLTDTPLLLCDSAFDIQVGL